MKGLMQDYPLLIHTILDHAARNFGDREIVTRSVEGGIRRSNYAELHSRARKVAKALEKEGIQAGERVATMAWNTDRHLETWYGIMGMGAVCHTINPRLFPEQVVYIANHAQDRLLFVDTTFLPLIEKVGDQLPSLEKVIVLTDADNLPQSTLPNVVAYEEWLQSVDDNYRWRQMDENSAAAMCYTSGTTGDPKGVVYSHRSNVLHALMVNQADGLSLRSTDTLMPVVPMFHANAWALAFAGPAVGAKLVMPGAMMDGESIYQLLDEEQVSVTAAVPTIWSMLLQHLESNGHELPVLDRVLIGGSACPPSMMDTFEDKYDVRVIHAWGMTEMSPLGTMCTPTYATTQLTKDQQRAINRKQGRVPYLVEMKIVDDDNNELPWDGQTFGRLLVKGPCVSDSYFKLDKQILDDDGWFDTGDVATIDEFGFMQITDRAKDVIKSGGEWISSIDIENVAVAHPRVAEAAVIGLPHPKWEERPLLIIVASEEVSKSEILEHLQGKIAKWWMPDDVVFVDEIPHTATGKISKKSLRDQFADYRFPS
jgi:fatty-acyl-CoA synthase